MQYRFIVKLSFWIMSTPFAGLFWRDSSGDDFSSNHIMWCRLPAPQLCRDHHKAFYDDEVILLSSSSSSSPVVSVNDDYKQQLRRDNNDDDDVPLLQRSPLSIDNSDSNDDSSSPGSPSKQTRQSCFRRGFQYPRCRGSLLVVVAVVIFCGGYRQQLYYKKDGKSRNRNSSSDDRPPDRQYRNPNLVADKASHHQQHHPAVLLATNIRNLQVINIAYSMHRRLGVLPISASSTTTPISKTKQASQEKGWITITCQFENRAKFKWSITYRLYTHDWNERMYI